MNELEIFKVEKGAETLVKQIDFGRLIAGGPPVTKVYKVKILDKVDSLRLIIKKLDDLDVSVVTINEGDDPESLLQLVSEGTEIPLTKGGKESLLAGDQISFAIKVEPRVGGKYNPEFELSYLIVPKR